MTTIAPDLNLPPDHPLRQILDTIAAHPEVRESVLRVLLTEDFLALPAQVQELSGRVDGVAGQVEELTHRVDGVAGQVGELREDLDNFKDETREQFLAVNARLDEHTRLLSDNTRSIGRIEGHVGRLRVDSYESLCIREISVILDGWIDRPVLADREMIGSALRHSRWCNQLSRSEYLDGLRPDIIAHETTGKTKPARYAVVEASITFNRGDIENAARRAEIISRVMGCQTDAFVVTHHEWPVDANEAARQLGVTIIQHQAPEYETE